MKNNCITIFLIITHIYPSFLEILYLSIKLMEIIKEINKYKNFLIKYKHF